MNPTSCRISCRAISACDRSLYGVVWVAVASAGVVGPILMARAFDATGTYQVTLTWLAAAIGATALFIVFLPRYDALRSVAARVDLTANARDLG